MKKQMLFVLMMGLTFALPAMASVDEAMVQESAASRAPASLGTEAPKVFGQAVIKDKKPGEMAMSAHENPAAWICPIDQARRKANLEFGTHGQVIAGPGNGAGVAK